MDEKKRTYKITPVYYYYWDFSRMIFNLFFLERLFTHERIQNKMNLSDMQILRFQLENQSVNTN